MPNKKKYISADYLLNILCDEDRYDYLSADDVLDAPTANVSEVKHGEWIGTDGDSEDYESGHSAWIECECSCCKYVVSFETGEYGWGYDEEMKIPFDYCPHCGADMRGDTK